MTHAPKEVKRTDIDVDGEIICSSHELVAVRAFSFPTLGVWWTLER